jgi:hypothetical protein
MTAWPWLGTALSYSKVSARVRGRPVMNTPVVTQLVTQRLALTGTKATIQIPLHRRIDRVRDQNRQ